MLTSWRQHWVWRLLQRCVLDVLWRPVVCLYMAVVDPGVYYYEVPNADRSDGGPVRLKRPPGKPLGTTRVVCVSDTHGWHEYVRVPACDVLIHAGDGLSEGGDARTAGAFLAWVHKQCRSTAAEVICTGGNHDTYFESLGPDACAAKFAPARWVQDDVCTTAGGLRVYASPYSYLSLSANNAWQYKAESMAGSAEQLRQKWDTIQTCDVLVTHAPPLIPGATAVGCKHLAERVAGFAEPPRVHVFGHCHLGYGVFPMGAKGGAGAAHPAHTVYVNAGLQRIPKWTILDLPLRPPIVIDIQMPA